MPNPTPIRSTTRPFSQTPSLTQVVPVPTPAQARSLPGPSDVSNVPRTFASSKDNQVSRTIETQISGNATQNRSINDSKGQKPVLSSNYPDPQASRDPDYSNPDDSKSQDKNILLRVVQPYFSVFPTRLPGHSRFIPSCRALYFTINSVYSRISRMRGFTDQFISESNWPQVKLYFALLFYLRIFDIQIAFGFCNEDIRDVIDKVFTKFPRNTWTIPEPMVPFFQALCSFTPASTILGPVYPACPAAPGTTAANFCSLQGPAKLLLPPFALLVQETLRTMSQNAGAPNNPVSAYDTNIQDVDLHVPIPPAHNANGANRYKLLSPGLKVPKRAPYNTAAARTAFRNTALNDTLPEPYAINGHGFNDNQCNTWMHYLRLDGDISWISTVRTAAQCFDVPFNNNVTFDALPRHNGAFNSVTCSYTNEGNAIANVNDSYALNMPLTCTTEISEPPARTELGALLRGVSDLELQIGMLSQLKVSFPPNYGVDGAHVNVHGNNLAVDSLSGPYFDPANLRQMAIGPTYNIQSSMQEILSVYLSDKRLNKSRNI